MSYQALPVGRDVPNDVNVIIEIPMHSPAVKYEVDKASGALFLNRMLKTAMHYPCNYGYIPHTLCGDGDPTDVMVVMPVPVNYGAVVTCRPVGVLLMEDESGEDAKILAVPTEDVTGLYRTVHDVDDVDELLRLQIYHFFDHYKDLETGKWVKIIGWRGADVAKQEILDSVARYNNLPVKPTQW
ncbi:MAG: inorganic diphosphatase [Xanthomonadales bacterium]